MTKLVVFTGYLGVGKSTLAQRLAQETNWRLLQIDKLRRLMIPQPAYNHQEMRQMYQVMLAAARVWLKQGFDTILDAAFSQPIYHAWLKKLIQETAAEAKIIFCFCSDREATARLRRRMERGEADAADATVERYFAHKKVFKLIDFCPVWPLNTDDELEVVFKRLKDYLGLRQ